MSIRKLIGAMAFVGLLFMNVGQSALAAANVEKVADTRAALRDLWSEHVVWVRNVVLAQLDKNAQQTAAAETQVVANARQIADSIAPFYGQAAANQLFDLLKGHYGAIRQYFDASSANDKNAESKAKDALVSNAGAIAKFLSGANPNLPYDTVNGLLVAHGGHHLAQIDQLKAKHYTEEATNWIAMRKHMNTIADAIAGAIAKQFPEKFN
ncbi:MAG TPA: hypothetical protein VET48_14030 [Steroidobacteraceae bacterium]|nr:hypothetical protein [Steroidobacteraceae bacterium]